MKLAQLLSQAAGTTAPLGVANIAERRWDELLADMKSMSQDAADADRDLSAAELEAAELSRINTRKFLEEMANDPDILAAIAVAEGRREETMQEEAPVVELVA